MSTITLSNGHVTLKIYDKGRRPPPTVIVMNYHTAWDSSVLQLSSNEARQIATELLRLADSLEQISDPNQRMLL